MPGASLILGAALLAFELEQRPAAPYHLGAPPPGLEAEQKPGLALWLAEQVNPSKWDRSLISRLLRPVTAFVATLRRASRDIDVGRSISELSAEAVSALS